MCGLCWFVIILLLSHLNVIAMWFMLVLRSSCRVLVLLLFRRLIHMLPHPLGHHINPCRYHARIVFYVASYVVPAVAWS